MVVIYFQIGPIYFNIGTNINYIKTIDYNLYVNGKYYGTMV